MEMPIVYDVISKSSRILEPNSFEIYYITIIKDIETFFL
jgi:hypothetical protein